jgi:hypothetical protein
MPRVHNTKAFSLNRLFFLFLKLNVATLLFKKYWIRVLNCKIMTKGFFPCRPVITPSIYAYEEPGNAELAGFLKIGFTNGDAGAEAGGPAVSCGPARQAALQNGPFGVFSSAHMNGAVYNFKRYEDSSLAYTGIDKHEGERVGGWDTVVSRKEYGQIFENKPAWYGNVKMNGVNLLPV